MKSHTVRLILAAGTVWLAWFALPSAQVTAGSLRGQVVDSQGAPAPGTTSR